jgi:GNAT superfamily N-acetyltransferase
MDTLAIRSAGADDLATVARLAYDIWWQHYPGIITPGQIRYMLERGYSHEALAGFFADARAGIALAERQGEALGFAAWHPAQEAAALKLDRLYVLPRCHGCGVGRALIEHVADRARSQGCEALMLNVNRHNTGSIEAYRHVGFRICDAVDAPIGGGYVMEDYIMVRALA